MSVKRLLMIVGWVAVLAMFAPVSSGLAGGPEPPGNAIVHGPEIWGEVVLFCSSADDDVAVIRVKRVVDCEVEAQALIDPNWEFGCSDDPDLPLKWSLVGTTFFGIDGTPFINKVKNYTKNVQVINLPTEVSYDVYSFDAQFMFWTPAP